MLENILKIFTHSFYVKKILILFTTEHASSRVDSISLAILFPRKWRNKYSRQYNILLPDVSEFGKRKQKNKSGSVDYNAACGPK